MNGKVLMVVTALALSACGGGETEEAAVATDSASAGMDSMGMAMEMGPPQDADHEFLRMMANHHEGLIAMGQEAMNLASDDSVRTAAHNLHTKQMMERDSMVAMIQRDYGEQHHLMMMPRNAAQVDSLRQTTGTETDRYFLQKTIEHHREGIGMIDRFLPRLTKAPVRQMAETMKSDQQREIQELEGKLGQL